MDLDLTTVRHVPVAAPPDAEAFPREAFVILQEVERNAFVHFFAKGRPDEVVLQKEFPAQPGPLRRPGAEDQPRRRA